MKKSIFFRKLFIIIIGLVLVDKGLGGLLQHFYFNIHHGEIGRENYVVDSCADNIVILGSSRAAHHYVPSKLSEKLNATCYNAGKDKQRLRYCLAILDILYKRYTPKKIILDLTPTAFENSENGLDELSVLLPYYQEHPEIRPILNLRNKFEWIKTYSSLYCYNSLPLKILFNRFSNQTYENDINGYIPLTNQKQLIPASPSVLMPSSSIDSSLVSCFEEIVRLTKSHSTELDVVVSPIYFQLSKNLQTIELAKNICNRENIHFFDFSQTPEFLSHGPEMFVDTDHLNDSSAILFTSLLAEKMSETKNH